MSLFVARQLGFSRSHTIPSDAEEATRLGARTIPKIQGRWPGNLDILLELVYSDARDYPTEVLSRWAEAYGLTFDLGILWSHQIITGDADVTRSVLATDFDNFEKSQKWNAMCRTFLGDGIFATDGALWKYHRSVARPFFSRDRISDIELLRRHNDELIGILFAVSSTGSAFDIQNHFRSLTMDVTTDLLFGVSTNALAQASKKNLGAETPIDHAAFGHAFDSISAILSKRVRIGASWYKYFEPFGDATLKHKKVIDAFIDPIVAEARLKHRQPSQTTADEPRSYTFLDELLCNSDGEGPDYVKDELLNFLLAGRDTTSSALSFCVYLLTLHPEHAVSIRKEVLQNAGHSSEMSAADLKRLPLLRAFIDETLRLFPPVPFGIRRSVRPTSFRSPDGPLFMPARASVTYSPFMFHRQANIWGEDAQEFTPERWTNGEASKGRRAGAFMPFNAGPRVCLGQQLAYTVISYTLVQLILNFSFELAPEAQPLDSLPPGEWHVPPQRIGRKLVEKIWPQTSFTMSIKGGLWVRVLPRESTKG